MKKDLAIETVEESEPFPLDEPPVKEREQEQKIEKQFPGVMENKDERWNTAEKLVTMLQFAKDKVESFREDGLVDDLKKLLSELRVTQDFATKVLEELEK